MIRPSRRRTLAATLALAGLGALPMGALAADAAYPDHAIRLIVPFPPGGGGDKLARLLATPLGNSLHAGIVVENKGGANGNLALQSVASAKADGYTIGLTLTDHIALNPFLYDKLPYDPTRDFAPIGLVVSTPYVLTVASKQGPATLADVLAQSKKAPGSFSIGYPTVSPLLATRLLQTQAGITFNMIPYRGVAQGMPDMLGGRLNAWVGTSVTMRGFIEGGTVRGIAVTSKARSPALPDVPTIAENGFPDFDLVTWYGLVAPAGTPAPVIEKLNASLNTALKDPEFLRQMQADGAVPLPGAPERFSQLLESDMKRLGPMIREAGIRGD